VTGALFDGTSRLSRGGERLNHFLLQSSFAQFAVVPANGVVKVRDDAPLETVCLLGCGALTGIGAVVNRAMVRPGEGVLILGVGGVGLSALLAARVVGAYPIVAVDRSARALDKASDLGATYLIDASAEDVVSRVHGIVPRGIDHAFDVVGAEGTIETCLRAVREGGQVVAVGATSGGSLARVEMRGVLAEKRLTGTAGGSADPHIDIRWCVDLFLDGRLPIDGLVTATYQLDDLTRAFDDMRAGRPGRGVVLIG
jgi:Zn-dependent alcohol dehydrogenase